MRLDDNILRLQHATQLLGPLADNLVFVGGSSISLIVDEDFEGVPRATYDVDAIAAVIGAPQFSVLEQGLIYAGFQPVMEVRCRYRYGPLQLDLVPTDENILGFGNRWYSSAFENSVIGDIGTRTVRHISAPYFLATKFEAFNSRGQGDLLASHDFEDIVTVINGRKAIVDEVFASPNDVTAFLAEECSVFLERPSLQSPLKDTWRVKLPIGSRSSMID